MVVGRMGKAQRAHRAHDNKVIIKSKYEHNTG